jgi:putative FmdB family regulatory protein
MPTYEYACKSCGEHLEVVQSFKDDALTTCPACGGPLRKVFGSIGISFKGSGFYKTDSRQSAKPASAKKSGDAANTDTAKGDTAKGDTAKGDTAKADSKKESSSGSTSTAAAS